MRLIERFRLAFEGKRIVPPREAGPISDHPGLQEDDVDFILGEHLLRKYSDRVFYGPGAEAAEARRAERINPISVMGEVKEMPIRTRKRKARDTITTLIHKRDKLKREVETHEKRNRAK